MHCLLEMQYVPINISSIVEFWIWWVLKRKIFFAKNQYTQRKPLYILRIQGAPVCQKLGMILESKVVKNWSKKKCLLQKMVA